jgi:hypothetical protein
LCAAPAIAASPKPVVAPVAHRAVYAISLAGSTAGSGVTNAEGRMVFEVSGSVCDGYTMSQRLVVRLASAEGDDRILDFRVSTFEAGNGELYRFVSRTYVNDQVVENVEGLAERNAGGIEVKLKNPAEKTVEFGGKTLFPSQHLQALLKAAQAEERFHSADIYEGAGRGESTDTATAVIGAAEQSVSKHPLMSGIRGWPVSIAYFSDEEPEETGFGEETPTYQMSFLLFENGVTRDLVMDYGEYKLAGRLQTIEELKQPDCAPN